MSTNLFCKEMVLIQTPTYITMLCYYADYEKQIPSDWKTIRDKYLIWRRAMTNGTQEWTEHAAHEQQLKSFKKLTFYFT